MGEIQTAMTILLLALSYCIVVQFTVYSSKSHTIICILTDTPFHIQEDVIWIESHFKQNKMALKLLK